MFGNESNSIYCHQPLGNLKPFWWPFWILSSYSWIVSQLIGWKLKFWNNREHFTENGFSFSRCLWLVMLWGRKVVFMVGRAWSFSWMKFPTLCFIYSERLFCHIFWLELETMILLPWNAVHERQGFHGGCFLAGASSILNKYHVTPLRFDLLKMV